MTTIESLSSGAFATNASVPVSNASTLRCNSDVRLCKADRSIISPVKICSFPANWIICSRGVPPQKLGLFWHPAGRWMTWLARPSVVNANGLIEAFKRRSLCRQR